MAALVCCKLCRWGYGGPVVQLPRSGGSFLVSGSRPSRQKDAGAAGRLLGKVVGCFPESKPERVSSWGYHPLEELSVRDGAAELTEQSSELSNAEVARTVADVNWSAVVFASVSSQDSAILGTEVHYLIDEHGDLYFEMDEDDDLLHNIGGFESHTVVIGIGSMEEMEMIGVVGEEDEDEDEDEEGESELEDEEGEEWELVGASDIEDLVNEWEGWGSDDGGSLWPAGSLETLDSVHPLEFGTKIAEVACMDHNAAMDKPSRHLTITGSVRRVTKDEEAYVQRKWFDRFFPDPEDPERDEDESAGSESERDGAGAADVADRVRESDVQRSGSEHGDGEAEALDRLAGSGTGVEEAAPSAAAGSSVEMDTSRLPDAWEEGSLWQKYGDGKSGLKPRGRSPQGPDSGDKKKLQLLEGPSAEKPGGDRSRVSGQMSDTETCFYKLEMIRIHLDSSSGVQLAVDVEDFRSAQPDVLAHAAAMIIQRVNGGGQKTQRALKALCKREKGLKVEEASLVGVDCLGVDLRIQLGIELKTLRFPFPKRATSEEMAEVLLKKMLFP